MYNKTRLTLGQLLEEVKQNTPKIEVGQYFETLKTFFPSKELSEEAALISYKGKKATKPLATSLKNKKEYVKDNHPFKDFYKDYSKGDILEVVEIKDNKIKCVNQSIKDSIIKEHYNTPEMKYIYISFNDILNGNIKRVYRGIKKIINK